MLWIIIPLAVIIIAIGIFLALAEEKSGKDTEQKLEDAEWKEKQDRLREFYIDELDDDGEPI